MPKSGNRSTEGNAIPTLAEYITTQIASKRAASLSKSRNRTMPAIPIINGIPNRNSCIYTATDNYGNQYRVPGNWTFYENPGKYGFKPVSLDQAVPGDIIQVFDKGAPYHAMTLDSFDEQGRMKYNYSRGSSGDESDIVKASINFPNTKKAAYTFVGTQADSTQWTNDYKRLYGNQMKCGGRRKAQLGLDIREGGIAIPIAPNMYYMDGRSHDEGGIAIGPNNKNGLEVEGGEVVKVGKNDVKVFSSVPLLRGASPAQLVLGGANPNKVFAAQEEFKNRNRINDDGTRYEVGGEKKIYEMPFAQRVQYARTGKITNTGYPVTPLQKGYSALRALGRFRTAIKDRPWRLDEAFNSAIKGAMNDAAKTPVGWDKQYNNKGLQFIKAVYNKVVGNKGQNLGITKYETEDKQMKAGGIYIKPSKRGTFTAAATKHGMGVQEFASKVLANKENYSPAMVKKANFARNASRWKKEYGGNSFTETTDNRTKKHKLSSWEKLKRDVSEYIMTEGHKYINKGTLFAQYPQQNVAQSSYLTDRELQQKMFEQEGYIKVDSADYGLVKKAVGNRDIPVYQKTKDVKNRKDLIAIGNIDNEWLGGYDTKLEHAGNYPTALYVDKDGFVYQKAWDLNDYGKRTAGNNGTIYGGTKQALAEILDVIGSPTVVTTGFQPVYNFNHDFYSSIKNLNAFNIGKIKSEYTDELYPDVQPHKLSILDEVFAKKGLYRIDLGDSYTYGLPEVVITAKKHNKNKKEYGGSMIYEINGNVKNGLMASRPKAQYGKQTIIRNNKEWEYDEKSGAFVPVKDVTKYKTIAGRTYKKEPNSKNYVEVTDSVEKAKLNKPKEMIVKQNNKSESNKESPAKKNKYVSTTKFNTGESYIINPLTGEWIRNGITETSEPSVKGTTKVSSKSSSTPRGEGTKSASSANSKGTAKVESPKPAAATNPMEARYASRVQKGQSQEVTAKPVTTYDEASDKNPDKNRYTRAAGFKAGEAPASPGNNQKEKDDDEKAKDTRWVGQYKPVRTEDWIGLGSNLAGSVASYFMTKNAINKTPNPIKPVMAQAAKLKTKYNVEPQLTEVREAEQMNRVAVRRNTQSSNTSLAREQRLMNEARGARNTLYGQKENIETQLINQDRLNRQTVYQKNVDTYNNYLNRIYLDKQHKAEARISNINNLIGGLTGSVNNMLNTIETRRTTNNTLRAIAAANPNVDARLIGGFDYYEAIGPDGKRKALYDKHQKFVRYI